MLFGGDSNSVIDDLKVNSGSVPVKANPKVFLVRGVLHGIVHQVQERAGDCLAIHPKWWDVVVDLLLKLEAVLLDFEAIRLERAADQIGNVGFAEAVLFLA